MNILFLHGLKSTPGGLKPTQDHGLMSSTHIPDDFEALRIAQAEYDHGKLDVVVVGSSRGGAVAMNIDGGSPCAFVPGVEDLGNGHDGEGEHTLLHSEADETVPIADSEELIRNSRLPPEALIVVGTEHRLADEALLEAVEKTGY